MEHDPKIILRNPIIGPLFSALLLPLAGVSFIFGANGLGFLLMFLALLQWKRVKVQSSLPLENFFESLTTAIRYVRYTPGIKILLARHAIFSFFISIIPSLMPAVGLKELDLPASHLGFLFTNMAISSVLSGAFIIPWSASGNRGSRSLSTKLRIPAAEHPLEFVVQDFSPRL